MTGFVRAFAVFIVIFAWARADEGAPSVGESSHAVADLNQWVAQPIELRGKIGEQGFATVPLTKSDTAHAKQILWEDHCSFIRRTREEEMKAKVIEIGKLRMKFDTVNFGSSDQLPSGGRSLFLSMHGGGNTAPAVNESQWVNQVRLAQAYHPKEGIYLAPRAPTDTWNLWHEAHIDQFFARLIENLIVLENVNPDRVYIMGYSAGGDGVYQLAPRMADRWAAAAMMGGHPNEASPLGLRNIGFALQVGANDGAYHRNEIASEWGKRLDDLQKSDPTGYAHFTELHEGKGHWMDLDDKKAIPWMEKFTRSPIPEKVVWHQGDVTHEEFYWLGVQQAKVDQNITATRNAQSMQLWAKDAGTVVVRLNDDMLDLDQPVTIERDGEKVCDSVVKRTISTLAKTLQTRGDPELMFSAEVTIK